MNGKQAKRLRRIARAITVGAPDVSYEVHIHKKSRRTAVLCTECTKAVYRDMKREYRQGFKVELEAT